MTFRPAPFLVAPMIRLSRLTVGAPAIPVLAVLALGALAVPHVLPPIYTSVVTRVMIAALFACSFNLLWGLAGMPSFGHAAYYGLGAYLLALLQVEWGMSFWVAFTLAPLGAALFAILVGIFVIRLHYISFIMVTFATSQLLYLYVRKGSYSLTNGDTGLLVPVPSALHSSAEPTNLFNFVLLVTLVSIALLGLITSSPFGRTLLAIRENPTRVEHLGVPIWRYRLAAFAIAGYFGGVSGTLFGLFSTIVFPNVFLWTVSADGWVMVILGGMYYFVGPVFGAIALHLMNFYVGRETQAILLVVGIVLLSTVLLAPRGLADLLERLTRRESWRQVRQLAVSTYEVLPTRVRSSSSRYLSRPRFLGGKPPINPTGGPGRDQP